MATVLSSVRLILPERLLENAWIRFDETGILDFGEDAAPGEAEQVDGRGLFLGPGLIDTHVHGGAGYDFLDGTAEAFQAIARYHLSHGTTALCPTFATTTYRRVGEVLEVWSKVRDDCVAHIFGVHLEGPHLAISKAGAHDPKLLSAPSDRDIDWLAENTKRIAQMTIAPELPNALELIERCSSSGMILSAGHTEAREKIVRAAIGRGASKVTHLFNAMTYAGKAGLFREPGLAEYALIEDRLICELIADGFHARPSFMRLAIRCKGPDKLALVSDALAGAGLPVGTEFMLGSLRCKVGEGYCMLADGSALSGSATNLMDHVRILHETVRVPIPDAVRMASATPARILGIDDRYGSIARGHAADLVQFDSKFKVQTVWISGKRVSNADALAR